MLAKLFDFIYGITGLSSNVQIKIFISIIIIAFLWFIRFLFLRLLWNRIEDTKTRYVWKKTLTYTIFFIGLFLISNVWAKYFGQLGTFLGLLSAGIAIAMKEPLSSIAGWSFILTRKPFTVGDRIQIGEYAGDVIDIGLFQFTLMEIGNWIDADQSTGRILHIPNARIFSDTLANFNKGFEYIWNEIPILITFESDWTKAKEILYRIARKHSEHLSKPAEKRVKEASKRFMIFYHHLTPAVYTSVKDSGVLLTIRYLCEPRNRRISKHAILEDILSEFAKHNNIDFAYPTQRFYNSPLNQKNSIKE